MLSGLAKIFKLDQKGGQVEFKSSLNRFAFTEQLSPKDALWDSAPHCPPRKVKGNIFPTVQGTGDPESCPAKTSR